MMLYVLMKIPMLANMRIATPLYPCPGAYEFTKNINNDVVDNKKLHFQMDIFWYIIFVLPAWSHLKEHRQPHQ